MNYVKLGRLITLHTKPRKRCTCAARLNDSKTSIDAYYTKEYKQRILNVADSAWPSSTHPSMLGLYTGCTALLSPQVAAYARPFLPTLNNRSLQAANRVAPAVPPNRSTLQQGSRDVSNVRPAKSIVCQAATPQSTKLDSSMIWGDIMMLTATELASERLPKHVTGVLSLTLLAAWIGVGTYRFWLCISSIICPDIQIFATGCCCKR